MRDRVISLVVVLVIMATGITQAASDSDLSTENAELRQRLEKLEKEQAELKTMLMELEQKS